MLHETHVRLCTNFEVPKQPHVLARGQYTKLAFHVLDVDETWGKVKVWLDLAGKPSTRLDLSRSLVGLSATSRSVRDRRLLLLSSARFASRSHSSLTWLLCLQKESGLRTTSRRPKVTKREVQSKTTLEALNLEARNSPSE